MPLVSDARSDGQHLYIATRLRNARRETKVSLRELASRSGLSIGQLSKIETGKKPLTLRQFDRIRKALGVPLAAIFPDAASRHAIVRREVIAQRLSESTGKNSAVVKLADSFLGKRIEPFCWRNYCRSGDPPLSVQESEHFIFVLQGRLEILQAEGDKITKDRLSPGDSLYWHCDVPHTSRACGTGRGDYVEFYAVRYQTHGAEDTVYDELGTSRLPGFLVAQRRDPVAESGRKIVFLRQTYSITAIQLAKRMGIGVRHLAAIESGRRAPDVELLFRIARLFRRPASYLLGADGREGPPRTLLRADALRAVTPRRRGLDTFVPLADGMPDRAMHAYRVSLFPGRAPLLQHHPGEMCVYVLQGEVEFRTMSGGRENVEVMRAGDSLFADTNVPYDVRGNLNGAWHAPADAIQVFWSPGGTEPPIFDSAGVSGKIGRSAGRAPRAPQSH